MSIASKHAYRFKYLKSEQWQSVRLEALARDKGCCQICAESCFSNDAHHIWYPENIYQTTADHLVTLCRPCHQFVHAIVPECKTKHKGMGIQMWLTFRNAVAAWRLEKSELFKHTDGVQTISHKILLSEIDKLKTWISSLSGNNGSCVVKKSELGQAVARLRNLATKKPEPQPSP